MRNYETAFCAFWYWPSRCRKQTAGVDKVACSGKEVTVAQKPELEEEGQSFVCLTQVPCTKAREENKNKDVYKKTATGRMFTRRR
jgi:hypothetical protein